MRVLFGEFADRILASCQAALPAGGAVPRKLSTVGIGEPFFGLALSTLDSTSRLLRFRAPRARLAIGEE
jgi:hypothetical protein